MSLVLINNYAWAQSPVTRGNQYWVVPPGGGTVASDFFGDRTSIDIGNDILEIGTKYTVQFYDGGGNQLGQDQTFTNTVAQTVVTLNLAYNTTQP